jgi:uncharacterized repeat protein (TIGR03803 family)
MQFMMACPTAMALHSFCSQGVCADGEIPKAGLVQATDGDFCGTTWGGGAIGLGTVFRLSVGLGPFVETRPTSGKVGKAVKILGTDLTGATSVTFNGTAAGFKVVSRFRNHNHRSRRRNHRESPVDNTQRHAFE